MSNLFNSLSECLGFSQIMKLTEFKTIFTLKLISSRFPIGVDTIYKPFERISTIVIFIFIVSCAPVNNQSSQNVPIINFQGEISTRSGGAGELLQQKLLKAEGIQFDQNGRINLEL